MVLLGEEEGDAGVLLLKWHIEEKKSVLVERAVVGARGGGGTAGVVVAALLVDDAHELHPGVVLRVATHAPGLPHGGR